VNQPDPHTRPIDVMRAHLERAGFVIGPRDPKLYPELSGSIQATFDWGMDGDVQLDPYCMAGDDIDAVVTGAYEENAGDTFAVDGCTCKFCEEIRQDIESSRQFMARKAAL
jgi:hypothetical protein